MMVKIEGNVRVITKDMTLYGSHIEYNLVTGSAKIKNARILNSEFNLVATELLRISPTEYLAKDAEFTTCKDCTESWSIYGRTIRLKLGDTVQIRHGLFKVKGANVIYLPYVALPILTKRKSGLLFSNISNRVGEGLAFEQPVFIALDESKDMTVSPTFWAKRGYGGDLQYRQRFRDLSWFEFNSRQLNDSIYVPAQSNVTPSGQNFFRYFAEAETHQQWTSNFKSHVRFTGARDLDVIRDNPLYTDPKTISSDMGLHAHTDYRRDLFSLTAEADYMRNQLYGDPLEFDRSYVQVLPRVGLSSTPYSLVQSKTPMFQHITMGLDGSFTRFRQVDRQDSVNIRNADRLSLQPYLMWHYFTWGPVSLKSRYVLDQQVYKFVDPTEPGYGKSAGLMQTEVAFTMDKIFGLSYEEKIPIKYISMRDLEKLRQNKEQGLAPLKKTEKVNPLVGSLPTFASELSKENIIQVRQSYRHSQEYKFIHHYIANQDEYGNRRFDQQVRAGQQGWFDYEDAIRANEFQSGAPAIRNIIPPQNTVELQWNNTLIRKTPKTFNYLEDDKFLRDNFNYSKMGYFNVSQGYLLNAPETNDLRQKLTRLYVTTGYVTDKWSTNLAESYFHYGNENIFTASLTRKFESINIFSNYSYNSFKPNSTNALSFGGQVRPVDVLGLAMVKSLDLEANRAVRTVYSVDFMPNNNCWIFNLNYLQSIVGSRTSMNIMFNFGDDRFDRYRTDYFAAKRL